MERGAEQMSIHGLPRALPTVGTWDLVPARPAQRRPVLLLLVGPWVGYLNNQILDQIQGRVVVLNKERGRIYEPVTNESNARAFKERDLLHDLLSCLKYPQTEGGPLNSRKANLSLRTFALTSSN